MQIIPQAFASDPDVDLLNLPHQIAIHLGISDFAGGLIASVIILMMISLPLAFLKAKLILILLVDILAIAMLIGIGWLPIWIIVLETLFVVGMFASFLGKSLST